MKLRSAEYGASMPLSFARLAEYLRIARSDDIERLRRAIDHNTLDDDRHPNAVLLGAVVLLHLHSRYRGFDVVDEAMRLGQAWGGETSQTIEAATRLWRPGGKGWRLS